MKLLSVAAENFGSYKNLRLDFNNKGLTLISGPTGAGKSTIMDSVSWALFGKTAKNGSADEVVKWGSTETTSATVNLANMSITRTRNPNDLYYTPHPTKDMLRGKDLKDTQLRINELLGVTPETFLAAVYMHEFSLTSEFFQTNAKNRRQIMEQLTDLALAKKLQENSSDYAKMLKQDTDKHDTEIKVIRALLTDSKNQLERQTAKYAEWTSSNMKKFDKLQQEAQDFYINQSKELSKLHALSEEFEASRKQNIKDAAAEIADSEAQIASLKHSIGEQTKVLTERRRTLSIEACKECGTPKNAAAELILQRDEYKLKQEKAEIHLLTLGINSSIAKQTRLKAEINPYTAKVQSKEAEQNTLQERALAVLDQVNPYDNLEEFRQAVADKKQELDKAVSDREATQSDLNSVKLLQEVVQQFRGHIISNTVSFLQNKTNQFLEAHFEAEFRAVFTIAEADSLDTEVYKDGILCSYTQLSKGQRQMLKLCFGAAIQLAVANYSGVQFNTIFMDEVLTGLDETNKGKAFGLIQELANSYENIYIIEHNESFKTLFTSRIDVSLENGHSVIYESN